MDEIQQKWNSFLRDENQMLPMVFAILEAKLNVPRETIAAVSFGLFGAYLVFGYFAQLVCNVVGFAYPAYASMLAIESTNKDDDTQWLTYWTVYAVFSLIDFGAEAIYGWFPFYWLAKCIFLIYLYHPLTFGAKKLYENQARPLLQWSSGVMRQLRGQSTSDVAAPASPPPTDATTAQSVQSAAA